MEEQPPDDTTLSNTIDQDLNNLKNEDGFGEDTTLNSLTEPFDEDTVELMEKTMAPIRLNDSASRRTITSTSSSNEFKATTTLLGKQ